MCARRPSRTRVFTLIELIIAVVILSISIAAIGLVVATTARGSADPAIQSQALFIAESYLEEALLKAYADPDGIAEGCAVPRAQWDDVQDYGSCLGSPTAVADQQGNALAGLASYRVQFSVSNDTVLGQATRRVEVQVTHTSVGLDVRIAAQRAAGF
jgi:MSHA pilin protein MshD